MEPTTPERVSNGTEDAGAPARPQTESSAETLSTRELEVLQLLADGCSNREAAERLVVSVETVKTHVGHILAKLGARHRSQAVAIALRRHMID
jgi:LuxR family maltose regulon positive regulatory protein